MRHFNWGVCILIIALFAVPADALVLRRGQSVEVAADETIDDDLIAVAGDIEIKGTVTGNVCAFAQTVDVSGDIGGTLFIGAASSNISTKSVQSVWAMAGNTKVSGNVSKNIILAGGSLDVQADTRIGKDLIAYGGSFTVNGEVTGAIRGSVGSFVMAGKGGRVKMKADRMRVDSTAVIVGDLYLTSKSEPVIDARATIGGDVSIREVEPDETRPFFLAFAPILAFLYAVMKFVVLASKLIAGILLIALLGNYVRRIMDTMMKATWKCLGIGFLGIIVIPVAAIILFVTIVGYPLGILSIYAYTVGLYAASIFVALIVGEKVIQLFKKGGEVSPYFSFIIGMLILFVLSFIPVLNFLVRVFVCLFGFGAAMLSTWELFRDMRGKGLL